MIVQELRRCRRAAIVSFLRKCIVFESDEAGKIVIDEKAGQALHFKDATMTCLAPISKEDGGGQRRVVSPVVSPSKEINANAK